MKIVLIGGTGLIGAHVVQKLTLASHEAIPAARYTGVDLITGDGLEQVLKGAEVVINLADSPTFDEASLDFFRSSMTNLLAAGATAGVRHQVVLSIVGADRVPQVDYFRAKTLQEGLLRQGPTPYSIVRATQFFEFVDTVISWTSDDTAVRLPPTQIQPVAAADVVDTVVEVSLGPPLMGIRNVAGPDVFRLDELGRVTLSAHGDGRSVITDYQAGLFAAVTGDELVAGPDAERVALSTLIAGVALEPTHYLDWIQK
ncbi:MAG TPA: SDR family oxidoreductase [Acidimicrobiales bacterium]|nr:SDR family oxidoreductase [Acidimicrobiales bacterium]